MTILFVYGSLRQNHHNHYYLEGAKYLQTTQLNCFQLYRLCNSYPTAVKTGNQQDKIVVEVYQITDTILNHIDCLEGHPNSKLFHRRMVASDKFEGWMYYCQDSEVTGIINIVPRINCGDWTTK